jgi:hypothetical protein
VPIALNKIYQQYSKDSQNIKEKNFGLKAEKKIQEKYQVTEAILEEELDEYGEEL